MRGAASAAVLAIVWAALAAAAADAGRLGESVSESARAGAEVAAWEVSPNWSGYVLTGSAGKAISYSRISGTWKVPTVTCGPKNAGAASAVWVGLGGYRLDKNTNRGRVEQVGTNADCDASGKPEYYAWFEIVPFPATTIENKVLVGDTITGVGADQPLGSRGVAGDQSDERLDVHAGDHLGLVGRFLGRVDRRGAGKLRAVPVRRGAARQLRRDLDTKDLRDKRVGLGDAHDPGLDGSPDSTRARDHGQHEADGRWHGQRPGDAAADAVGQAVRRDTGQATAGGTAFKVSWVANATG